MEISGIEPEAYRLQSGRDTTTPYPLISINVYLLLGSCANWWLVGSILLRYPLIPSHACMQKDQEVCTANIIICTKCAGR
jgi:hypothetical protein